MRFVLGSTRSTRPAARISAGLAGLFLAMALPAATSYGAAPGASAEQDSMVDVGGALTTAEQSSVTVTLPVPAGVTPTAVRGRLAVGRDVTDGRIEFRIGSRLSRDVAATSATPFDVPIVAGDIGRNRTIDLRMTYTPTEECPGGSNPADITYDDLRIRYRGTPALPRTLADFFPSTAPRVDVVIPPNASDDVIEAGLTAVASLSAKYGEETAVVLSPSSRVLPRAGLSQRVVRITSGADEVSTAIADRFGLTTLTLSGSGDDLVHAAQALGSDRLSLAGGDSTSGLSEQLKARSVTTEHSLSDLGASTIELEGPAPANQYIGIRQDSFGGPIDSLSVHVTGTHSVLPEGTEAQLNTYLNGYLLDSQLLDDEDPDLTIDATADSSLINAENGLEFTLTTAGVSTDCVGPPALPIQVFFDSTTSKVSATRGDGSTTGFAQFPQVLGGELPVAIRPGGPDRVAAAADAALVITSLQRAAANPIAVDLVDADQFLADNRSGLLVGADAADATALEAPLRLDGMRLVDYAEAEFRVGTDQPFAALEAISGAGRHVLMLGGWGSGVDGSGLPADRHAAAAYTVTQGWGALTDDLLVASGDGKPYTLSSNSVVPQEEVADERRGFVKWLVLGFVVLGLLLAYQVVRTARRDKAVRTLVDAQVGADDRDRPDASSSNRHDADPDA